MKYNTNIYVIIAIILLMITSCKKEEETYQDLINENNKIINKFIINNKIQVISLQQFEENKYITDISKNEYVKLNNIYFQIVKKGNGEKIYRDDPSETFDIYTRCKEINLVNNEITFDNFNTKYPDVILYRPSSYRNASFVNVNDPKEGLYSSEDDFRTKYNCSGHIIPNGWYIPLQFITPGYTENDCSIIKTIVPFTDGTQYALSNTIPFYYEISFTLKKS